MIAATHHNWLLETGRFGFREALPFAAWVSDPQRFVVGYGRGKCEVDAVRAALAFVMRASPYADTADHVTGLKQAYFASLSAPGTLGFAEACDLQIGDQVQVGGVHQTIIAVSHVGKSWPMFKFAKEKCPHYDDSGEWVSWQNCGTARTEN